MKKLSSLLLLALFLFTGLSMKAQDPTYYRPGSRLSLSQITEGTNVFIYSMCYVNGNINSDYSRFIVNSSNNATTLKAKPGTFVTSNVDHIWKVASKTTYISGDREAVQLVFKRKMGSEVGGSNLWDISGSTNNADEADGRKMVVTQWTEEAIVSGTSKSGADVRLEDAAGNIIEQSALTETDPVYLVSALSGKSINTNQGNYHSDNANGYPVAFYAVEVATTDLKGFHVSTAPAAGATAWADGTTWYKMLINSVGWRYLDTSASYCDGNGNLKMSNTAEANNLNSYWAITGNDTNGYKFYNAAAGPSKVLGVTGSDKDARMTMVAEGANGYTTSFDITLHTDGYLYIKKHGTVKDYINCREGYVALWGLPEALGNSGSAFQILPAELTTDVPTAFKTNILNRVGMWKKVPAIWPGATEKYNALNAVRVAAETLNTDLVSLANAANAASDAFVSAVDGVRFTASNRDNRTTERVGAYMYLDGSDNTVKGRTTSTLTMDEVMTMKPNGYYFNFKIYNASLDKYVGTPGGATSGVALADAANFDLYTSNGFNDNVVIFCINGTATMHLLNELNVSNYSSTSDMASRWLLRTDVSRHELQTAINNATTFRTNLETLVNNLVAAKKISVKPTTLSVTLPTAITKAQNALNNASGTPATRTAAIAPLNATLTKAKGAWLGELGTTQQFRLKSHAITTSETPAEGDPVTKNYYLTMAQTKNGDNEGNAILAAYDKDDVNQIFTLVPGTGANAGKYILVSNSKQLKDLGFWNTDMADAGTPYGFEDVDVANSLFRVRTTQGLLGPNNGVTGDNLTTGKNKFLYTNHSGTRDNLTWELEFIAPTLGAVDKTSLQATLNAQNFVKNNSFDIVNQNDMPSVKTYIDIRENAEHVIDGQINGRTVTQIDVNTAEAELKAAYEQVLNNFISEADPTQGYRLIYYHPTNYTAKDLFLTFNTDAFQETNVVNALQLKRRSAATRQTAQFVSAGSDNSFYIMEGFNKKQVGESATYNWNPKLVDNGKVYTFEYVTLDGIDGIVVRLKNPRGHLGCDVKDSHLAVAENDYLYTNNSENNYWIIEPCVSPDLVMTLYGFEKLAEKYEGLVGTGVGQYTAHVASVTNADLVDQNTVVRNYINDVSGNEKTTSGVQYFIDYYNAQFFPFTLNMPEAGKLYRFKGKKSKKYMASSSSRDKMVLNEANGIETVFKLVEDNGNYKLLNCGNGYFITNTHDASALKANANTITFNASESSSLGYYTIKTSYSSPYIYDDVNETEVDRNSSYAADYCDWTIEEVTYLPVPINTTVGFGTLYSPVDLKGDCGDYAQDERLEFYYGKKQTFGDKDKLVLTKLTGDIPAETGFIVKYKGGVNETTGCVFMKIADSAPKLTEGTNQLKGTLETIAKPTSGTVYTLQNKNNMLGFYKYTGENVKGGKAYYLLADDEAASMGFVFDFEGQTTGVESIEVNTDNQVIYDLSGRRVAKAGKGLYIINGKKVLVK
ncbi:MAG: hypothetical protein MR401_07425 [Bacteroidales bacterium]|nr:hypothetical protein [Bacteroidales bacterium]